QLESEMRVAKRAINTVFFISWQSYLFCPIIPIFFELG
ncbi:MAG: hypothetical protein ACI9Z3_001432, partial [Roseivirga sp.]